MPSTSISGIFLPRARCLSNILFALISTLGMRGPITEPACICVKGLPSEAAPVICFNKFLNI